jgi:hypothetical protein
VAEVGGVRIGRHTVGSMLATGRPVNRASMRA